MVYPDTPTLSVDGLQVRLIWEYDTAVALRLVGTVGGSVSLGMVTVMDICFVTLPVLLVAVNVYVVLAVGLTVLLLFKATDPIPWSMDTDTALVVVQVNTTEEPAITVVTLALSVAVGSGSGAGVTVMLTLLVAVPVLLVAVNV